MRQLNIRWLGSLPYSEALVLQKGLKESVSKEYNPYDYLLLLEHNNVITIGRTGDANNLLLSPWWRCNIPRKGTVNWVSDY